MDKNVKNKKKLKLKKQEINKDLVLKMELIINHYIGQMKGDQIEKL